MNFEQFRNKYQQTEIIHYPNKVPEGILVSVLVQTYNHEAYIKKCLDSILEQKTSFEFEILLGEDASSDKTREICIEYAQKYPDKIRLLLHHPTNKIKVLDIITGNFNAFYNFYQARGKFIAFCEGDDYWTDTNKLQLQADFLSKNKEYSLCFHKFKEKIFDDNASNSFLDQALQDIPARELAELKFHPLLSTACFRGQLIKKLPEEMLKVINVDSFLLSILGKFGPAKFQDDIEPTIYRRHVRGIWSGKLKPAKLKIKINTLEQLIAYHKKIITPHLVDSFGKDLKNKYRSLFVHFLKNGDILKAVPLLRNII